MTRIVCISDTHEQHRAITVPDGDILIHAGDLTYTGGHEQLRSAMAWMASLPHAHKIFVAGNHDWGFDELTRDGYDNTATRATLKYEAGAMGLVYLQDAAADAAGLKVWGSADQPEFCGWAFNRTGPELLAKWATIPEDVDIVVTHGPPYGIGDATKHGLNVGCKHLQSRLYSLTRLRMHVCGHIHEGYGHRRMSEPFNPDGVIHYVNASICNVSYNPINAPIVVDL